MPQLNERVIPVNVSGEAEEDLKKIIEVSGMKQAHVLRYVLTAALRVLAERDSVTLPIRFTLNTNGEHLPREK